MKFFLMPRVALSVIFFFLLNIAGCSSGGSNGGEETAGPPDGENVATFRQDLADFNGAMERTSEDMLYVIDTVHRLNEAIDADSGIPGESDELGFWADRFEESVDGLLAGVEEMDRTEAGIQAAMGIETGERALIVAVVGAGLVISGLYSFGRSMREKSQRVSEARKKTGDVDNIEGHLEGRREMGEAGAEAIQELGTKVTTDLILTPVNPSSMAGVILKDAAGNTIQRGLKVLSTTEQCKDGYDAPGCVIGVGETDEDDPSAVAGGNVTIVIGGGGTARIVIEDEPIPPGTIKEVTREAIPIEQAGPDIVKENDGGRYVPDSDDPTDDDPADDDPADDDPADDDPTDDDPTDDDPTDDDPTDDDPTDDDPTDDDPADDDPTDDDPADDDPADDDPADDDPADDDPADDDPTDDDPTDDDPADDDPADDDPTDDDPTDDDPADDDPTDDDPTDDDPTDDDPVSGGMALSYVKTGEDATSISYGVTVAVSGVVEPIAVTISVENAATSGPTRTLSSDGTITWPVTVLQRNASVSVSRSDTGERVFVTLPGKTVNFDGTYVGSFTTTYEADGCFCFDAGGVQVFVSGSSLFGDASGSVVVNPDNPGTAAISGTAEYGMVFSGTISADGRMSGSWYDPGDCCRGVFSLQRQ